MRALVLSATLPVVSERDQQGVMHRLRLYIDAMASLTPDIHIAHIAPASAAEVPAPELARRQAAFWGRDVQVSVIHRAPIPGGFRGHYLDGLADAGRQRNFRPFADPGPVAEVAALLTEIRPDLVLAHRLPAMAALLRSGQAPRRVFFDLDDVEHMVQWRQATTRPLRPGKALELLKVPAILAEERRAARFAKLTFVCSEKDERYLGRWVGPGRVACVPNALPMPDQPPGVASEPTLGFIGAMHHPPNVEAVERLARRILPLVRREVPEARLLIAGTGSEKLPGLDLPGVEVLGFVPEVAGFHARTRLACAPLVNGGGTRLKLIEAAAHARPMVSTVLGAEGLRFEPEREILLRDDDAGFAEACVFLLRDDAACARLGEAARRRALDCYSAAAASSRIAGLLEAG